MFHRLYYFFVQYRSIHGLGLLTDGEPPERGFFHHGTILSIGLMALVGLSGCGRAIFYQQETSSTLPVESVALVGLIGGHCQTENISIKLDSSERAPSNCFMISCSALELLPGPHSVVISFARKEEFLSNKWESADARLKVNMQPGQVYGVCATIADYGRGERRLTTHVEPLGSYSETMRGEYLQAEQGRIRKFLSMERK